MDKKYTPVPCAFYDEFEAAAIKGQICEIVYLENDVEKIIKSKIINLQTKDKEEFVILENNQKIRLDFIQLLNGESPKNRKYC